MRPYAKLRSKMHEHGDTAADIGRLLLIAPQTVSCKLCNKSQWTLSEMYLLMGRYGIHPEEMYLYFPPNGSNEAYEGYVPKTAEQTVTYKLVAVG